MLHPAVSGAWQFADITAGTSHHPSTTLTHAARSGHCKAETANIVLFHLSAYIIAIGCIHAGYVRTNTHVLFVCATKFSLMFVPLNIL